MKENKDKSVKDKAPKPRADKYEEKVSFDGTFDELLDLTIQPKKDQTMKPKTHQVDEIRIAYSISPVAVKNKVKTGDKIYTDDDWLKEIEAILNKCEISYILNTSNIINKNVHEITIKGV